MSQPSAPVTAPSDESTTRALPWPSSMTDRGSRRPAPGRYQLPCPSTVERMSVAVKEAQEFLAEHWSPNVNRREWMERVIDEGWAALRWPTEWYGRGLSDDEAKEVEAVFAAAGAPGPGQDIYNLWAGTMIAAGTDELKRQFLRPLLLDQVAMCLLYSEPGAGSDLAGIRTTAVRDGDEWVVNGQKVWTSGARDADYGMLIARTDWDQPKHRGISFFWFPMKQAGVEVRPLRQMTGDARFNEVFITDGRVPEANRLGDLNKGWWVLQTALAYERAVMGVSRRGPSGGGEGATAKSHGRIPTPDLSLVELLTSGRETLGEIGPTRRLGEPGDVIEQVAEFAATVLTIVDRRSFGLVIEWLGHLDDPAGGQFGAERGGARRGETCCAEGDGVFGVGVDRHRDAQLVGHHVLHHRHSARAAHQQDPADIARSDVSSLQGPTYGLDRLDHRRLHHRGELVAGDRHLLAPAGEPRFDQGIGSRRQGLFRTGAFVAQPRQRGDPVGVVGRHVVERAAQLVDHVSVDGRVEVDPAESLDALGRTEHLEPVLGLAEDGHVEGAAAEVVHGDDLAGFDPLVRRVVDGGGLGLAERDAGAHFGHTQQLGEQLHLVRTPVGRVGDGQARRLGTLLFDHPVDDPSQQASAQLLGGVRRSTDEDRCGVTDAPLELAHHPRRLGRRTSGRSRAGEHRAICPEPQDRRDRLAVVLERHHLGRVATHDRGSGERRPEVDGEHVRHVRVLSEEPMF